MKRILLTSLLVAATIPTFAQLRDGADGQRRGGFGQGGNRQVVRELESAQYDINTVINSVSNSEMRRKLRAAILKIDNAVDMLSGGGVGPGNGNGNGDWNSTEVQNGDAVYYAGQKYIVQAKNLNANSATIISDDRWKEVRIVSINELFLTKICLDRNICTGATVYYAGQKYVLNALNKTRKVAVITSDDRWKEVRTVDVNQLSY